MRLSVCGAPFDYWVNGSYVDVLLQRVVECSFSSVGSRSYSKEWVWKSGTKSVLHCSRGVKSQQGGSPGI